MRSFILGKYSKNHQTVSGEGFQGFRKGRNIKKRGEGEHP
jgi:hypothetical protein